ncbi:HD-domain/PDEase-like protein [Lichtheimia hyalospora FSU 10163]|nr:HD-domain/PDEase-like protein [Lichtheimia hyalospora FSU 10163]
MLILQHNKIPVQDLFLVEQTMLKVADRRVEYEYGLESTVLDKQRHTIYGTLLGCADRLGVFSTMLITPSEFLDFIIEVDHGYLSNPYHSFYHGADVAFMIYHVISSLEAERYLSRIDIVALYIAALCHDLGHPGFNNNFQVKQQTEVAKRYDNKSVLESYSSSLTLRILDKHRILRNIGRVTTGKTTEEHMRASIIKMILSTDMVFHYELQANLATLIEITAIRLHQRDMEATTDMPNTTTENHRLSASTDNSISSTGTAELSIPSPSSSIKSNTCTDSSSEHFVTDIFRGDKSPLPHFAKKYSYFSDTDCGDVYPFMLDDPLLDQQERQMMCQIILHAADISNPLRPWPVCRDWSSRVCQEFFRQGDEEKKHGLPFGDYIVGPYFDLFATMFPRADTLVQQLKQNRIEWQNMEEENAVKTTSTTAVKNADRVTSVSSAASSATNLSQQSAPAIPGDHGRQPSDMLPDRNILNPAGRRVSVAAGMVVIPDNIEESVVKATGKVKRRLLGPRSVSDTGKTLSKMKEFIKQHHHVSKNHNPSIHQLHHNHHENCSSSSSPLSTEENDKHQPSLSPSYLHRRKYESSHSRRSSSSEIDDTKLNCHQQRVASPDPT